MLGLKQLIILQTMVQWMKNFWTQNILSQKLIYEFQRLHRDCGGETQKRCIPFHFFPSSRKSSIFIHENSDSQHHLVFWGSGLTDPSIANTWAVGTAQWLSHINWQCYWLYLPPGFVADGRYFVEFRKPKQGIVVPTWTQESSISNGNIRQEPIPWVLKSL